MSSETSAVHVSSVSTSFHRYQDKFPNNSERQEYFIAKDRNTVQETNSTNITTAKQGDRIFQVQPEAVDPAILSHGSLTCRRYSPSALLLLRNEALSRCRPPCKNDPKLASLGIWKHFETRNVQIANGNIASGSGRLINNTGISSQKNVLDHRSISSSHLMPAFVKRRFITNNNSSTLSLNKITPPTDPKERNRKQEDAALLLSPQRKSTNMGYQIPSAAHPDRDLPIGTRERRIGSGRLVSRDVNWDYGPDKDNLFTDINNYRSNSYRDNQNSGHTISGNNNNNNSTNNKNITSNINNNNHSPNNNNSSNDDNAATGPIICNSNSFSSTNSSTASSKSSQRSSKNKNTSNNKHNNDYRSNDNSSDKHFCNNSNNNNNKNVNNSKNNSYSEFDRYQRRFWDPNYLADSSNNVKKFISSLAAQNSSRSSMSNDDKGRQYSDSRIDEPEWFSSGPTSQHDTIELRGFDESDDFNSFSNYVHKNSARSGSLQTNSKERISKAGNENLESSSSATTNTTNNTVVTATTTASCNSNDLVEQKPEATEEKSSDIDPEHKNIEFNFDDILQLDSLNDILAGDTNTREASGSRFSQWFNQSSPNRTQTTDGCANRSSRRSSLYEEVHDTVPGVPNQNPSNNRHNNSDKYFTPISPAANYQSNTLLEFLQRGKFYTIASSPNIGTGENLTAAEKETNEYMKQSSKYIPAAMIPSVEELEALMRKNEVRSSGGEDVNTSKVFENIISNNPERHMNSRIVCNNDSPSQQKDMEAFKKLLEQIAPRVIVTTLQQHQQQQQLSLQQMLSRSKQEDNKQQLFFQRQAQARHNESKQKYVKEHLNRSDAIKGPEAQSLIHGLARGEITQSALMQQLTNSATAARNRETVASVLNFLNTNSRVKSPIGCTAPHIISPVVSSQAQQSHAGAPTNNLLKNAASCVNITSAPNLVTTHQNNKNISSTNSCQVHSQNDDTFQPHNIFQQQLGQKQLQLSSLANGAPQRIPSPRELQYHTQTIMQSALIKKKLEEQQENYRRRQEIQKQQGPTQLVTSTNVSSDTNMCGTDVNEVKQQIQQQISSPTPLAFTPTSVLRKMTADKDIFANGNTINFESPKALSANSKPIHSLSVPHQQSLQQVQPRMILGGGSSTQQQQQQQTQTHQQTASGDQIVTGPYQNLRQDQLKWNRFTNQIAHTKPIGRPILKGGPTPTPLAPQISLCHTPEYTQQLRQQQNLSNNIQQPPFFSQMKQQEQQQQHQKQQQQQQLQQQQQQQQQQDIQNQQYLHQYFQQRKRATIRNRYQMQYNHLMHSQNNSAAANSCATTRNTTNQQMNDSTNTRSTSNHTGIINYQRDGGLSPTSNQLARWFSPELLAQASAGKLPSLNVGQALSLEEFERSIQHSSTTENN